MASSVQTAAYSALSDNMVKWLIKWTSQISAGPQGEDCQCLSFP